MEEIPHPHAGALQAPVIGMAPLGPAEAQGRGQDVAINNQAGKKFFFLKIHIFTLKQSYTAVFLLTIKSYTAVFC